MSIFSKCPSGTQAQIYIPAANFAINLACNGAWSPNQFTFTTAPGNNYMFYYVMLYGPTWLKVDDVVLTYSNHSGPRHVVQHPGVRNVSISGQNVIVDGSPYLSLGFYDVGFQDLSAVAATGANTINGAGVYNATDCFSTGDVSYMDLVYDLGFNFLPDSSTTARLAMPAVMPVVTQTFAPHLANIAWYLADEPDLQEVSWEYIPPASFIADYTAAKTETTLPMASSFQTATYTTYSGLAPYNGSSDIWMAEPYGANFSLVNNAVNLFNSIQARPIWLAQDDVGTALLVPKAYWAIIAGATGIHYFNWNTFKSNPADLAAATQVFAELKGLKNAIFGQAVDSLVTTPAGIASMSRFDPTTGTTVILSANSAAQNVQANFLVQGLTAGQQITVVYEGRTITAGAGSFSDTYAGISRHVYRLNLGNPPQ
jgi:hypothetical protein